MRPSGAGVRAMILAALLVMMSCTPPQVGSQSAARTQTTATSATTGQQPGMPAGQGLVLDDLAAGLAQQNNYRVMFQQDISGEIDSKPFERHTHLALSRASGQVDFVQEVNSSDGSNAYARVIVLGQALYRWQSPMQPCQGTTGEPEVGEILEPAEYLLPIKPASKVGPETVNGIPTQHYRFDQSAGGTSSAGGAGSASGDVWLAETGGHVVKYTLVVAAPTIPDQAGQKLAQNWVYEWQPLEQGEAVALPAGCIEVPLGLPILSDAQTVAYSSGMVSYTSAFTALEAANFYLQKLPELGWASAQTALAAEPRLPVAATFTLSNRHLSLSVEPGDPGGLAVTLFLTAAEVQADASPGSQPPAATAQPEPTIDPTSSPLPADIPLYPGATGLLNMPGSVMFNAPDAPDVVAKYYRDQMAANGWAPENETAVDSLTTIQTWKNAGRSVIVTIGASDGKTYVVVTGP
ncbi:MAG: hypothetical protein EHM39_01030 [Chloroflexi bacterium]|nr:MAG: hypothetical protein EHM39_01030 [Chloroflexota bacterium]